jgi:Ferritin-like/Planctomycete cytochrome C
VRGINQVDLSALRRTGGVARFAAAADSLRPVTSRPAWDDAAFWLTAAAEIEHSLMVEYLFAAYSLNPDAAGARNRDVARIKQDLLQIAREEMGHLITVQNVLLLVGAPLHLGREHSPYASQIYPFRFKLEQLSLDSLAKYVVAESPDLPSDQIPSLDTADKVALFDNVIKPAARRSNDGEAVKNVGPIYASLVDIVANRLRDEDFRLDRAAYQARWADWGLEPPRGALKVLVQDFPQSDAAGARKAAADGLRDIGQQGEAADLGSDTSESHFERFFDIYQRLQAIVTEIGHMPAWPVARDPNTSREAADAPPAGHMVEQVLAVRAAAGRISDARARGWAELFNVRYRLLLECLLHSLHRSEQPFTADGDRTPKGILQYWTFSEMRRVKKIAEKLVQMPSGTDGMHAGPPFELPFMLDLSQFEADRWSMHAAALEAGLEASRTLLAGPDANDPFLLWVADSDAQARAVALAMARTGNLPDGLAPRGFRKTLTTLEEGVRGFEPAGMSHGPFWRNKSRDDFIATAAGFSGVVVTPGKPEDSPLHQRISATDSSLRMPRFRPALPAARIDHIRNWIAAGAPDDEPPATLAGEPHPNPEPAPPPAIAALQAGAGGLSYARDIKVLFRAFDRASMRPFGIDLHDYQSVRSHAADILDRVGTGEMPCDGAWPSDRVERFRAWMNQDFPP